MDKHGVQKLINKIELKVKTGIILEKLKTQGTIVDYTVFYTDIGVDYKITCKNISIDSIDEIIKKALEMWNVKLKGEQK